MRGLARERGVARIITLVLALAVLACPHIAGADEAGLHLYIAKNGNDSWSGRLESPAPSKADGPFATLGRARAEIRKIKEQTGLPPGGVQVELRAGTYYLGRSFDLNPLDSGSAGAPIVYRARKGEGVRLSGGVPVRKWTRVQDPAVLSRLPAEAGLHVLQADLRGSGVREFGSPSGGGAELFFADRPMELARWPQTGFVKIKDVVKEQPFDVRGEKGFRVGKFSYFGGRPSKWREEKDLWAHGYWFWDWAEERQKVESIDTDSATLSLAKPYHQYGYRAGQWYYVYNALSELDTPGEWYLERATGILYFWPPALLSGNKAVVSRLESLVRATGVSHLCFEDLTLEATRGTAVTLKQSDQVTLKHLTVRNTGGWGVRVEGGKDCRIVGCTVSGTGEGGILVSGGARSTLTPALHSVENNTIFAFGRWQRINSPGIELSGVGSRIAHNHIFDAPHQAISFSGNNQVIEYNEINDVCQETNDAGAIYAGRDWTMRGNRVRSNYLHDIQGRAGAGAIGVYLDDMFSGTEVVGNIFRHVATAILVGGGRDNLISGNVFTGCKLGIHLDSRGLGWAAPAVKGVMMERLREVPYRSALWKESYPALYPILQENPGAAQGNRVVNNLSWQGAFSELDDATRAQTKFQGNRVNVDPQFVDAHTISAGVRKRSPLTQSGLWPPKETIGTLTQQ
jgi:parallel beta-helix repeat protein